MATISVAQIETVTQLYQAEKLQPVKSISGAIAVRASQSYNDCIGLVKGDITKLKVDAIVNAANNSLLGGGGVDGAIHAAAGPDLVKECRTLNGCETGSAKITSAYELPCKKVIHAVGPIYDAYDVEQSERDLTGCYETSLDLAVDNDCDSIAFSALSTGVYGYPKDDAAAVAVRTVREFLDGEHGNKLHKIIFCAFAQRDVDAYARWLPHFFPPLDDTTDQTMDKEDEKDKKEEEQPSEDDWEKVEAGDSADNGPIAKSDNNKGEATVDDLPEVPKNEPAEEEGPATKKLKSSG